MRESTIRWGSSCGVVRAMLAHPRLVALLAIALLVLATQTADVAALGEGYGPDGEIPYGSDADGSENGEVRAGP